MAGNKAIVNSVNPSDFETFLIDWDSIHHVPGMSVSILKNGEAYWQLHHGFANIAQNKPVTDSTAFLLCSISKLITQTAAMQLYEQDAFSLYDSINDYLPFTVVNPNHPDSIITFFHLMTHTSSIQDNYSISTPLVSWGQDSPISTRRLS